MLRVPSVGQGQIREKKKRFCTSVEEVAGNRTFVPLSCPVPQEGAGLAPLQPWGHRVTGE